MARQEPLEAPHALKKRTSDLAATHPEALDVFIDAGTSVLGRAGTGPSAVSDLSTRFTLQVGQEIVEHLFFVDGHTGCGHGRRQVRIPW